MKKFSISKSIREYKNIYKNKGLKGLVKEKGRNVLFIIFMFYLIKGIFWLIIGGAALESLKNIF